MRDGKIVSDRATKEVLRERTSAKGERERPITAPVAPVSAVPVAPAASPPPDPEPVVAYGAPSRVMPGAVGALVCGIATVALALAGWGTGRVIRSMYDPSRGMPPKPYYLVAALAGLTVLAALVLGIVSIAWGARVRKRIRIEPGDWTGRKHAGVAMLLGAMGILAPFVLGLLWRAVN